MMPGDSQPKAVAIAADATVGNCQNCSVLQQTLTEYVSSLLVLKQKIADSDDKIRLQEQLEELQIKLVTLEKKTVDYDSMQDELEEKKSALVDYEQKSEEIKRLKQENSTAAADNEKLEGQLAEIKELAETRSLENSRLKREKAVIENDLLETQTLLKKSQAQAIQVEKLTEENNKISNMKDILENKVNLLDDSVCEKNHQISQLTKEKLLLERNIHDLQVRLMKLEREMNKDYRNTSTQATAPEEPKVDKDKVRKLLEKLWACVEIQPPHSEEQLHLNGNASIKSNCNPKNFPPCSPKNRPYAHPIGHNLESHSSPVQKKAAHPQLKTSPRAQIAIQLQVSPQRSESKRQTAPKKTATPKKTKRLSSDHKTEESSTDLCSFELTMKEIMEMFRPLPPCLSPLPDLDTETELVEAGDGKDENPIEHCSSTTQQEAPISTETLTSFISLNDPTLTAEEEMDVPVVTDISPQNEFKDLEQNELCNISEMEGSKSNKEGKKDTQIEMEADVQVLPGPSSSTSADHSVLADMVSETVESDEPSDMVIENASGKTQEDQLETPAKIDVEMGLGDLTDGKSAPLDVGMSVRGSDDIVYSEEADVVQPAASDINDSENTDGISYEENDPEVGKTQQVCPVPQDPQEGAVSMPHENDVSQEKEVEGIRDNDLCISNGSGDSASASKENAEEIVENADPVKILEGENNHVEQKTECVDGTPFSPESHTGHGLQSPHTVEVEDVEKSRESEETVSFVQTDLENGSTLSQETNHFDCESLKVNEHSLCRRLSPVCLFPTVKLQRDNDCTDKGESSESSATNDTLLLEKTEIEKLNNGSPLGSTHSHNETLKVNGHSLCRRLSPVCLFPSVKLQRDEERTDERKSCESSTTKEPPLSSSKEEYVIKKTVAKHSPNNKIDSSSTTSLSQPTAVSNGLNTCLELHSPQLEEAAGSPTVTPQPLECLGLLRSEMGPPLPTLLTPLKTSPKAGKSISPRQAIGKLLFPSPMHSRASPNTPVKIHTMPNKGHHSSLTLNSPLPSSEVPSSPLQFGSATPKHAVPVPGRLPVATKNSPSSSSSPSQENSMRILDTMYPDMSARARTLSILRGNVGLGICSSENGALPSTTTSQASGFKTINSTSTAFTKAETRGEKRPPVSLPQPRNSKCRRLDTTSPTISPQPVRSCSPNSREETASPQSFCAEQPRTPSNSGENGGHTQQNPVIDALQKIKQECFDLLPVIKSHVWVGNLPKKPVLRDEEKDVLSEVCHGTMLKADDLISAILNKLKAEKRSLGSNYMQALCRVYVGVCRQKCYWEKVHVLAYTILTEDYPDAAKMVLFMATTWPSVFSQTGSLCQAIHTVTKMKAQEEVLSCLTAILGWEKTPPCDIDQLISRVLSDLRSGSALALKEHGRYGYDLDNQAWEHVFTLHLLCAHKKWKWTYEHILGKELWPVMNTWVTQPRDQQTPVSDVTVATVVRLIGRLGQLGIKERCVTSVLTVASVVNAFGRHGVTEGVPWEVQLAAVYCMCELSPCNPKQALDALAEWRAETSRKVPPAVTSCINQLASICRQVKS